jgi:hypothetical protein
MLQTFLTLLSPPRFIAQNFPPFARLPHLNSRGQKVISVWKGAEEQLYRDGPPTRAPFRRLRACPRQRTLCWPVRSFAGLGFAQAVPTRTFLSVHSTGPTRISSLLCSRLLGVRLVLQPKKSQSAMIFWLLAFLSKGASFHRSSFSVFL